MNDLYLNINQVIQLAALGPCLLILVFLIISSTRFSLTIVPLLFFLSVSLHFLLPILKLFPEVDPATADWLFLLNRNLEPPLGFLLILQFVLMRVPPAFYWLIFTIPLLGGGPFLYMAYGGQELCIDARSCFSPEYFLTLYRIFGGALIFLLLIPVLHRTTFKPEKAGPLRKHKYWLIVTLVFFNLLFIGVDLAHLAQLLPTQKYLIVQNVLIAGFVYLVLSSIFRVFSDSMGIRPPDLTEKSQARDRKVADKIRHLLENEKPYCELSFNRKALSDLLKEKEHVISRSINIYFGKSFSELMNEYRVKEAKAKLLGTRDPITTISFDCGFSSVTSFNRVFKDATGLAPSEFRKQSAEKKP